MPSTTPSILPFFLPEAHSWHNVSCCTLTKDESSLDHLGECQDFSLEALAWAIQNNLSPSCIERYFQHWPASKTQQELGQTVRTWRGYGRYPILFFAIERNSPEIIRILCRAGADPSQTVVHTRLPVLAYCILSAEYELSDTTDSLFALLAMGADPFDLPRDMWCDYIKAPHKIAPLNPEGESTSSLLKYSWCTPEVRAGFCRTFNLLQRYHFNMSSLLPRNTARQKQVAKAFNLTPLFEIPYQIIGQRLAAKTVQEWLMSHALHHVEMPLVLLFTGPSGHGKTELAKRMGELLSLPLLKIDCTHLRRETDLFGAQAPYAGWQDGISHLRRVSLSLIFLGSQLNNFLVDRNGQKAVVFLDEFDKMDDDVYNSLLLLFDEGHYTDRRSMGKVLDCTKTIWVLASNQGEELIQKFWDDHVANKPEHHQLMVPLAPLQQSLERSFHNTLGAPLTGRLSAIIPFMPFSVEERAVTTYKFMRKLFNDSRKSINVQEKQLARHIFLNFVDDGELASHIAQKYYFAELGARSLLKGVNMQILHKLTSTFLDNGGEITDEMNDKPLECYDVRVEDLKGGLKDVTVKANGTRSVQKRPENYKCCPLWKNLLSHADNKADHEDLMLTHPKAEALRNYRPSRPSKRHLKKRGPKRPRVDDLVKQMNKKMRIR